MADDGTLSNAMAEDGVTAVPPDSAKVGDKSKLDKAKYPADPTRGGDRDEAKSDQTHAGAGDEQAATFKRSI